MLDFFLDQLMLLGGPRHVNDTEAVKETAIWDKLKRRKMQAVGILPHSVVQAVSTCRQLVNPWTKVRQYQFSNLDSDKLWWVTQLHNIDQCCRLEFLNQHLFRLVGKVLAASLPKACSGPQESLTNVKSRSISPGDNAERRRRHLATTWLRLDWLYCIHICSLFFMTKFCFWLPVFFSLSVESQESHRFKDCRACSCASARLFQLFPVERCPGAPWMCWNHLRRKIKG